MASRLTKVTNGAIFWQVVRFGATGLALTVLMSGLYLGLENWAGLSAGFAVVVATTLATIVGFFAHSVISFQGFGARDRQGLRFGRFLATNGVGLLLNYLFVKLLVDAFSWPSWSPIPLFLIATPGVTFILNRRWVFR